MAAADPVFESLQSIPSMTKSFNESLFELCIDNDSESVLDLRKNLMEYYHNLHKSLQSRYENLMEKPEEPGTSGESKENETSMVTGSSPAISSFTKVLSCVDVGSEIKSLCDKADRRGIDNIKEVETLRNELTEALRKVPDAAKLVMNALEPPFSPNRNAEILLLKSLYTIVGGVVPSDVQDSAREFAKAWRKEVEIEKNTDRAGRANIRAFLQFLVLLRIAADYEREELWGLLLTVSSEVGTPELCRSLGLTPNVSEFIDKLSKSGNCIEALRYADEFGMLDKVDHMDLLTSYLKDVEKAGKEVVMNAQDTAAFQTQDYLARLQSIADNKLKAAMRTVIKLVRMYGSQSHFFEDELRKLEQEEEDKIAKKERMLLTKKVLSSFDIHSELKTLCDKADGRGLRNYIIDNMKELETLRNELPVVLRKVPCAAKLVMNALEHQFCPDRKPYILLVESLYKIFDNNDSGVVPSDVKDSAREIANAWRKKVKTSRAGRANLRAFLKFLASFRIAADYERDELWGLLLAVSSNRETIELCRCLGLSPNISEFIDKLSESSKHIEAFKYADAFGMLDKVDYVNLLTSYLRDVERAGKEVMMNAQVTAASQTPGYMARLQSDADRKLREARRTVISLVTKYGFESHLFEDELRKLEPEEKDRIEKKKDRIENKIAKRERWLLRNNAAKEKAEQEEDGKKGAGKKAQEKEDGKKAAEKKAQEKEDRKKAAEKKAQEKEDGKKPADKEAQEKEEQEDRKKDAEKKAQHKRGQSFDPGYGLSEREKYTSKRAKHASLNETARVAKKKAEQEEDRKKAYEKKAEQQEDRKKAYEKKVQEKEDGKKDVEKKAQHKRRQSFEPGYGLSERENYASKRAKDASLRFSERESYASKRAKDASLRFSERESYALKRASDSSPRLLDRENYASKRAKDASLNETTRVAGGIDYSKASPYNIDGVQNKYVNIGHDHHTSAFSAANTGLAAGAFASAPSIAAQINNERRRYEGYPLAFGTSNRTPIGSSLYSSSVPAGAFAFPLSNVAEVNYEGRGQQSYMMNFGEVYKNHVRTSEYGTGDLANSFATQSNYNFEGRGEENYQLNFGEIHNNPVRASAYVTGVSENSSATQCHYERSVPELYTSTFGGGSTAGIVSSVYGSNPRTIPSVVNQGSHERSFGQSSGFAGRNMVSAEIAGYESGVSTVPPSSVNQGHFEKKGSVIDRYRFNSGLTSLSPAH